jgi:hypothetical protein
MATGRDRAETEAMTAAGGRPAGNGPTGSTGQF